MSQHNFSIADESGAAYLADVNNALQALASQSAGATEPATRYAYQSWADTTNDVLKIRNAANSAWIIINTLEGNQVVSRASNVILSTAHYGVAFVATANFTQTLTAAATLGNGWWCDYRIEAGITIVFDPNGAENIDGAATKSVTGPAGGRIYCDGSGFKTVGLDLLGAAAPLASPAFTGNPTAPTASGGDNDTSIATTAFVQGELAGKAPLASPTFTGTPLETMGTGSGTAALIGKANINTTAVGNVGGGEDDLMTFSLAANSLSAVGKGIRVTAWGTAANNANAKSVRLAIGGVGILVALVVSINSAWKIDYLIISTGTNTQDVFHRISQINSGATPNVSVMDTISPATGAASHPNVDTSTVLVIKCTGTGVADNDIVQEGMLVEYIG